MNRFPIFIAMLFYSVATLSARTISGIILSSKDSTAVVGANCRLLSGGKQIAATVAGTNGDFSLETDLKTALNLEVLMTGYSSTAIIIESGAKNYNLGTVFLDEGIELEGVTVTANTVVRSKGRTIVYPAGEDVKRTEEHTSELQ